MRIIEDNYTSNGFFPQRTTCERCNSVYELTDISDIHTKEIPTGSDSRGLDQGTRMEHLAKCPCCGNVDKLTNLPMCVVDTIKYNKIA